MTIQPIAPKNVRYIKLGEGGCWESDCIRNGTIRLGYASNQHKECIAKEWDKIKDFWLSQRKGNQGAATRDANQIRDFYELAESDLWITIRQRKLYWCHAAKEVVELTDKTRIRHVIGQWHSTDINNQALWIENLDGRVTQVTGFRGTICDVKQKDYLVCKINGQKNTTVLQAEESLALLNQHIKELIKGLWWHDFELLIELIFSKFGWQRFSVMGKREKDIDLDLRLAANDKGAVVQIRESLKTPLAKKFDHYKSMTYESTKLKFRGS